MSLPRSYDFCLIWQFTEGVKSFRAVFDQKKKAKMMPSYDTAEANESSLKESISPLVCLLIQCNAPSCAIAKMLGQGDKAPFDAIVGE